MDMKELAPHPSPQDIYLMSIVDEMSKKYLDVSVNRGKRDMIFIYSLDLQFKRLGESMKFKKEIRVTRIEIEKCQALGVTPKKIYVNDAVRMLNFKQVEFAMTSVSLDKLEDIEQHPYILESEHNRLVDELKSEIQMLKDYCNDLPRDKQIKPNSDWGY